MATVIPESMLKNLTIRSSSNDDLAAIELLYPRAFPDEDLVPVVQELLQDPGVAMSLVATVEEQIVGHIVFTSCYIPEADCDAALLAPLAVDPDWHRKGIGSAIVRDGLERLLRAGVPVVFVLGDPAYYSRFEFEPETFIEPPYNLPEELKGTEVWQQWKGAWQSKTLTGAPIAVKGKLSVPGPWQHAELWTP